MKKILYFTAPWCGPCKILKPKILEVANELSIKIINVDASPEMASYYNVRNIPCAVLIDDFGNESKRLVGNLISVQSLKQMYNQ